MEAGATYMKKSSHKKFCAANPQELAGLQESAHEEGATTGQAPTETDFLWRGGARNARFSRSGRPGLLPE